MLMLSLYAGPDRNRWWFRPFWQGFGALAQLFWYLDKGQWQHAVWAQHIHGEREYYMEFSPTEARRIRNFPLFFVGQVEPMSQEYYDHYRAPI